MSYCKYGLRQITTIDVRFSYVHDRLGAGEYQHWSTGGAQPLVAGARIPGCPTLIAYQMFSQLRSTRHTCRAISCDGAKSLKVQTRKARLWSAYFHVCVMLLSPLTLPIFPF